MHDFVQVSEPLDEVDDVERVRPATTGEIANR
jgi:hypothetical protein